MSRFKELAEEARNKVTKGTDVNTWIDEYNTIFGELIAKECADLFMHDDVTAPVGQSAYGEAYQDGWIEGTKAYRHTILDHFGVN